MTRRITWIILLTVWATLIAGSVTAYLTTRSQMLRHLDHVMMDQLMKPRIEKYRGREYQIVGARHQGDRTETARGKPAEESHAELIRSVWIHLPGEENRRRSIVARVWGLPVDAKGQPIRGSAPEPIVLAYSREAYEFDPLMNRVAIALVTVTLVGGVIAAALARLAARSSLRPLRSTADVIGTIDDRSLDRRIDASKLPPELVPMAEKLNAMLERLDRSMQQRRRFLADASHELRTPVAALMVALELATRKPRDPETYRQTLEACLADARHLRRLVEALMSQVKSEGTEDKDQWAQVSLQSLIGECVSIVAPLAEQRSVSISHDVDSLPPLRTQPTRLRSVLLNLLANAVEYNRDGGSVEVLVSAEPQWAEIQIADTGPGIAPDKLPYIFQPFFRGDDSRQASEHLGLGLFLVHSHVRELGGQCTVESEVGKGTRFRIRLPAKEPLMVSSYSSDAMPMA